MNLLSKLHKNSILTGPIESYCLTCGYLLRSEEESYAHINEPGHVDKLSAVPQLPDHNDCIIKSKEGYYCRYCNIILPTIKRVGLHVAESYHGDNKNSQDDQERISDTTRRRSNKINRPHKNSITRNAGVILAFDAIIINQRAWNGLDGSTCSVCNEDYDDEEDHKRGATHILNLIQIKCEFGETFVYRKVDEVLFFCLICNEILPINEKTTHHTSEKHLTFYEKSKTEGAAVQKHPAIESNNKKDATIELNNNSVSLPASEEAKNIQILDTKEAKGKPNTQENKAQNGSAKHIDNNTSATKKNTQEPAILNTGKETPKLNTEKVTSKESKSESQSKIVPEIENKYKTLRTNSVSKETKKPEAKVETAKPSPPVNIAVSGTAKVQTDKEPYLYEHLKARDFLIKAQDDSAYCTLCDIRISEAETRIHSIDPHHRILYAKHVARKASQLSKNVKGQDPSTVNKAAESNGKVKPKGPKVTDKENAPPLNSQINDRKEAKTNDKVEAKGKVSNESKGIESTATVKQIKTEKVPLIKEKQECKLVTEEKPVEHANKTQNGTKPDNQPKEFALTDKENTIPNKENEYRDIQVPRSSPERNKAEIKPEPTEATVPTKKGSKKAQKKAAKAKTAETEATVLPKEVLETGKTNPKVSGLGTSEAATEERGSLASSTPEVVIDADLETVGSKVRGDASVENTENKDAAMTAIADLKTEKLLELLKTVSQVDSNPDDVVINGKYVLGNLSFVLIVKTDGIAECGACDEELTIDEIHKHIEIEEHRSNVEECLVVTSLDDEFIRQMKAQKYHCGYCNMLLPSWGAMQSHLDSYRHSDAKTSASWRLERYLPYLKHCETREVRSVLTTIFRCTRE